MWSQSMARKPIGSRYRARVASVLRMRAPRPAAAYEHPPRKRRPGIERREQRPEAVNCCSTVACPTIGSVGHRHSLST